MEYPGRTGKRLTIFAADAGPPDLWRDYLAIRYPPVLPQEAGKGLQVPFSQCQSSPYAPPYQEPLDPDLCTNLPWLQVISSLTHDRFMTHGGSYLLRETATGRDRGAHPSSSPALSRCRKVKWYFRVVARVPVGVPGIPEHRRGRDKKYHAGWGSGIEPVRYIP